MNQQTLNPLAAEINLVLEGTIAGRLMSDLGRRFYFPKGIIAQSAEAKKSAHFANGTIGMAFNKGSPLILSAVAESMASLSPEETVAYAPTAGVEKARNAWKELMLRKNPSLNGAKISLPVVVPGLTAGLTYVSELFFDSKDSIIASDPCWDNYSLIFETRRQAEFISVPFMAAGPGLDLAAIAAAVERQAKTGAVRIIFNFPNNPSGYSPTVDEAKAIAAMIEKAAQGGADVLTICDDAYFGLFYEKDIEKESLFARFAKLHRNVLAVKIDGPIKEDYVWGLRVGFMTFGSLGLDDNHCEALVRKLMGAIRSSVSCANTSAQYLMLKALEDSRTPGEKANYGAMLQRRYQLVKAFIGENPNHPALSPLPFNSGYFMSFRCNGIDAETLRRKLLAEHGVGTIALGKDCLRVAFSSIDEEKIPQVYRIIYDAAKNL